VFLLCQPDPFDRPRLEPDSITFGTQKHHRTYGEGLGDTGDELSDMHVVPDPLPLEVGQLDLACAHIPEELLESRFIGLEQKLPLSPERQEHHPSMPRQDSRNVTKLTSRIEAGVFLFSSATNGIFQVSSPSSLA